MRFSRFAATCLVLAACADEPSLESTAQEATAWNKLSSNKLSSNKLSSNKLSSNKLSSNKLSSNKLSSNSLAINEGGAEDLLATADGREVLTYIVSCALPDGIKLVYTHDGTTYEFPGLLGLAPKWADHPLDKKGQGWVSACLFARVNAHDTAEEISLRGKSKALTVSEDEAALYTVQEGAFYGNYFTDYMPPAGTLLGVAYACRGADQAAGEFGGLVNRDCAEPDPAHPERTQCTFSYAGDCADYTPDFPSPYACRKLVDGNSTDSDDEDDEPTVLNGPYYTDCFAGSSFHTKHSKKFKEVITVYVTP